METTINTALALLDNLSTNELRLLQSEIDARVEMSESSDRSLLWETIVVELQAIGAAASPGYLPANLRRLIKQGEKEFEAIFEKSEQALVRTQRMKLYRIAVREATRMIKHSPRPLTAKTICQVFGEPGGGPASILENAFPGYSLQLPQILFREDHK